MVSNDPNPHLEFCYIILRDVSRSFAVVIQQLPLEIRDAVCLFYVILRALDTVEDDMSIPIETKAPTLKAFHEHIYDPTWEFVCGKEHSRKLMEGFQHVARAFLQLSERYQGVIADATKKMGAGMAKFIVAEVKTIEDYDEYCHYVAGLVGCGLSKLFAESGLEDLASDSLSNSMGLFLQKVNVTRDYLEDINEFPVPRKFWPREIWGKYGTSLEDFREEENEAAAVACLNDMITDALRHAVDSLQYMSALKDSSIFRFCAISQIMAIATLATCYNNARVFKGVVKINHGIYAKILLGTNTMADVYASFHNFTTILQAKIDMRDPSATQTLRHVNDIINACGPPRRPSSKAVVALALRARTWPISENKGLAHILQAGYENCSTYEVILRVFSITSCKRLYCKIWQVKVRGTLLARLLQYLSLRQCTFYWQCPFSASTVVMVMEKNLFCSCKFSNIVLHP